MTVPTATRVAVVTALAVALAAVTVRSTATLTAAAVYVSTEGPPASERYSKRRLEEPAVVYATSVVDPADPWPAGRKFVSDDDYRTLSSMTSDVVVEASATATGPRVYPKLTTGSPTGFATRGRYIRNPFGNFGKGDHEMEFDDDRHADFILNGGGAVGGSPKWNRYTKLVVLHILLHDFDFSLGVRKTSNRPYFSSLSILLEELN